MVDIGQLALVIGFVVTGYVAIASFGGVFNRMPELTVSGRYGLYTVPVLLAISTLALVNAFVTRDFSVRYVAENSNLAMEKQYTWVALYAGNAGSLLFLAFVFSLLAVLAVVVMRRKLPYTTPYATGIMALVLTFFLGVVIFLSNPLDQLPFTPADGQGINPLLLHFGMFIHPPVQMAGLISVAIPFSIAIGAMLAGRGGRDEWVDQGRLWGMVSWVMLTGGLLLGSWWAYTILGWGGYWFWDPVENSALMPWLAMTAFVHSIMVQKRRGMFRMWNMVLIIVAFTLAQLGMFINRGGPVPSVHSFAQSTMGWLFLFFMAFTLVGSMVAFLVRIKTLKSKERLDSVLSRESVFLAQNVLFLIVAFVTLWGTIFPIFSEAVEGTTVTVGPPFYNRVNGPLLLLLVLLMGVGPLLPWRKASVKNAVKTLRLPAGVGLVTGVALAISGIGQPVALAAYAICAFVVAGIVHEWVRGTRSRNRKGEIYPAAFGRLLVANRPRYGGYIVHLGIMMLAIGAIASSFYGVQRDFAMSVGDEASLGDYSFRYLGVDRFNYADRQEEVVRLEVRSGDKYLGGMEPFRAYFPAFKIAATRGAIRSTPIEDFYVVPSEIQDDGQAVFRVLINPLVWWMWASGPVMLLGVVLGLSPQRLPAPAKLRVPAYTRMAGT